MVKTVEDLLKEVKQDPNVIDIVDLGDSVGGKRKNYGVWYKTGSDSVSYRVVSIWITPEGAKWDGSKPVFTYTATTATPTPSFAEQLRDVLNKEIADGKIIGAMIEQVDDGMRIATVKIYRKGTDGIVEERYVVTHRDKTISYEKIL